MANTDAPIRKHLTPGRLSVLCQINLTLRLKLCGRGPRAEADAVRRLPRSTPEEAKRDLQPPYRRDSSVLTRRLGRRASAGPHQLLAGVSRLCPA